MLRRCLLAVAGLAVAQAAGCGPIYRTTLKAEAALGKAEASWMPNRLDYTVYQPSHRVALATFQVLKAELKEARIREVELTRDKHYDTPEGKTPAPGSIKIPDDYPGFWLEGVRLTDGPMIVNCRYVQFSGKAKDGQNVDAVVRLEIMGSDQRTVVSVQVGRHGDAKPTKDLIDKISDRVQNPSAPPGSLQERAALNDALDPGPRGDVDYSATTGDITIRMN